jgi:hypothetical protein
MFDKLLTFLKFILHSKMVLYLLNYAAIIENILINYTRIFFRELTKTF